MKRRIFSLVIAGVLLISVLAACGSSGSNDSQQPTESTESTKSVDSASEAVSTEAEREMVGNMYVEGLPVLKEKETYTIAVGMDPNSKNTMAEKEAVIEAENQTNIHIEWQEIPNSGWSEKVNILLASGDLPDAFAGHVDVMNNTGVFTVLNDIIDKYGKNIKEMFAAQPELEKGVTAPDGNIYSLPTNRSDESSLVNNGLWINKAWLDKLGLSLPTTTDEFVTVLRAFKEKDPNGNNVKDEIPFGALQNENRMDTSIDPMFGPFGVVDTPEYVYAKDGKVIFTGAQEGYYKGLVWLHQLYSEGLIDQEVFTLTSSMYTAKAQNKDILFGSLMVWLPDGMDSRYDDDYVSLPPLKGPDGDALWTKARVPTGELEGFTITTKCKTPEVLVRYYDNNISTLENMMLWFNGPEGKGIWKRVDGDKWEETLEFAPEGANMSEFERTVAVGPNSIAYLWSKFDGLRVREPRILKRIAANEAYLKVAVDVMPKGLEDSETATKRNLLFTDIDNYMKKFKANSIVEGISEAQWNEHLNTLKQLKVEEYVELWQKFYDSHK